MKGITVFDNSDHFREWTKLADAIAEHGPTACTNDPDGFFPDTHRPNISESIKQACAECPIRLQCGEYGIFWEPNHGVWGGLSAAERRKMRVKMGVTTSAPNTPRASLLHDQPSSSPRHELSEEEWPSHQA